MTRVPCYAEPQAYTLKLYVADSLDVISSFIHPRFPILSYSEPHSECYYCSHLAGLVLALPVDPNGRKRRLWSMCLRPVTISRLSWSDKGVAPSKIKGSYVLRCVKTRNTSLYRGNPNYLNMQCGRTESIESAGAIASALNEGPSKRLSCNVTYLSLHGCSKPIFINAFRLRTTLVQLIRLIDLTLDDVQLTGTIRHLYQFPYMKLRCLRIGSFESTTRGESALLTMLSWCSQVNSLKLSVGHYICIITHPSQ